MRLTWPWLHGGECGGPTLPGSRQRLCLLPLTSRDPLDTLFPGLPPAPTAEEAPTRLPTGHLSLTRVPGSTQREAASPAMGVLRETLTRAGEGA